MKIRDFLIKEEMTKEMDIQDITDKIKNKCKPFLKESKGKRIYRGSRRFSQNLMITMIPRRNRKPSNSRGEWHEYANEVLEPKFGWKPRSEGVFTIPDPEVAVTYGNTYLFFPVGNFKYLWSSEVSDFFIDIGRFPFSKMEEDQEFREKIRSYFNSYTDKNLHRVPSDHEIIFKCKKYYLVKQEIEDELYKGLYL